MFETFLETIIGWYAPHSCVGCGVEGALICRSCLSDQAPARLQCYRCQQPNKRSGLTCRDCRAHGLDAVTAAKAYGDTAKALVWCLKFQRGRSAAANMAAPMAALCRRRPGTTLVVPLPTAPGRARTRGYDQAVLLAKALARRNGFQYCPLLQRVSSVRQVGASHDERQQQMRGAFRLHPRRARQLTAATHIILVDDVVTTGSSLESAAQTIRPANVRSIEAIVFAQAQLSDDHGPTSRRQTAVAPA